MRLAFAFVALLVLACRVEPPLPPPPVAEDVVLRARIEALASDPYARVLGVPIASRPLLLALYERRGFHRGWTSARASDELLRAIRDSAGDGLDPEDYLLSTLEAARAELVAGEAALETRLDYDLLQTEALIRLVDHLSYGKVDPKSREPRWSSTRLASGAEAAELLNALIDSGEVYARIEVRKPRHELYVRLRAELARQRELQARGGLPIVPEGEKLEPGARGPRVAALRARLGLEGESEVFDAALADAVSAFQTSRGIDADGVVGAATLAALNRPLEDVIAQIRVNLERGRWYLRDLDQTFVAVNIAGFQAYYLRDGGIVWSARAIIGKPFRETPVFRARMTYLVLNPTWTVPPTILENDMLPEQRRDPSYLERKGLQVIDRHGNAVPVASIDWSNASAATLPYNVVQGPGPENPLGRVKFMFPNDYSVYLHDTPTPRLFDKSERAFSSGCIRIEHPLELATLLLEGQEGWDRAALEAAIATGETRTVRLERPVPVLVAYWTAWVGADGVFQLRGDVYGRDPLLQAALDARFSR